VTEARDWRFPAKCPTCGANTGTPVRVAKPADPRIEIFVRCDTCAYEWKIECAEPPLILKPKPDSRTSSE
jgi:DNA-directed RNA polymerase subunit M/transcription elongation factor TFIIS